MSDGGPMVMFTGLPLPMVESPALDDDAGLSPEWREALEKLDRWCERRQPKAPSIATADGWVIIGPSLADLPVPLVKLTIRRPGASASLDLTPEQVSQLIAMLGGK